MEKEFKVAIHDIATISLLRMVDIPILISALERYFGDRISGVEMGSKLDRVSYCYFTLDRTKVYYQVCGLFSGDEYFIFKRDVPNDVVDKVLSVFILTLCEEEEIYYNKECQYGKPSTKEIDIEYLNLHDNNLKTISSMRREALEVFKGKKSYFNTKLKNYSASATLADAIANSYNLDQFIENVVNETDNEDIIKFLMKQYLEYKLQTSALDKNRPNFTQRIEYDFKAMNMRDFSSLGDELEKHLKELTKNLSRAYHNPSLISTAEEEGAKLLPSVEAYAQKIGVKKNEIQI